jgi:Fe-Mn family superoxide dismutase
MSKRRTFIKHAMLQGITVAAGTSLIEAVFNRLEKSTSLFSDHAFGFDQQPLPYAYSALEPAIDAQTMELHYSKHAAAYCKNMKEAMLSEKVPAEMSLIQLMENIGMYSEKIKNQAGGHFNHELFWASMRAPKDKNYPSGNLLHMIEATFGSVETFVQLMNQSAMKVFGSGWTWLVLSGNNTLKIVNTKNQENPLMGILHEADRGFPLFGIDIWEHAYYLKYQNRRAEYLKNWWSVTNWDYLESRLRSQFPK